MTRVAVSACLVLFGASALTGCTPETPKPTHAPSPKPTPLFASDEEALAAATEAYQRYQNVANAIGQGGWTDTSGYENVEEDPSLRRDLDNAKKYSLRGWHQVGNSTFENAKLQKFDSSSVTLYVCVDVTDVDVLGIDGTSVVPAGREDLETLEIKLRKSEKTLLVNDSEVWGGGTVC